MSQSIDDLFNSAQDDQNLSPQSVNALAVVDIGANIQQALGVPAQSVHASKVLLVQGVIDDSGSIRFVAGNTEAVRTGVNLVIDALLGTSQTIKDGILMALTYLNDGPLTVFTPLDQHPRLDTSNYDPNGGTPLYIRVMETLKTVILKTQEFSDNGVPVNSITFIVSDGADTNGTVDPKDIAYVISDMVKSEQHIVAAIGIDDGKYDSKGNLVGSRTDFQKVFGDMGIPKNWIIDIKCPRNPGETEKEWNVRLQKEIRKAFATVSQSAVRASQGAQAFSQTAQGGLGGFAAP